MKNLIFLLILSISLQACTDLSKDQPESPYTQYLTMEEVKAIADKYGAEDLAVPEKNSLLMYMTREKVEAYFERVARLRAGLKEDEQYFLRTKEVHSFDDYLRLLQSLPQKYEEKVQDKGGPMAFQHWVEEQQKIRYHIYRDEQGVLTWIPASQAQEDDNKYGVRMDNN